ncbi:MAG: glycosyltransferase [Nitrosopumilus sp.]|nr:glycosyltransferase [Nitrosopumilus sp.]CAI9831248.1 Glycosyltransferase involved in cell wall biogenesis [Nitrosopumilaceae archaeon]MDA7940724.1 glycosyltransferase [Nitrosopumilus sp.]MDA7942932.1 glycosyltransferase [Nitrosopumilus sp.]MDA7944657.1 glycosyltransferase [Nitrosopumilus sp.]
MYEIIYYAVALVMAGVAAVWAALIRKTVQTLSDTPRLGGGCTGAPLISVILPARNEEAFIGRCLDSLLSQDYPRYEVVAVDDSSEDGTGAIIEGYAGDHGNVVHVRAGARPEGWTGKNWACVEGYRRASGDLLLFTDADTVHLPGSMSAAAGTLESRRLDALTVMPRMLALDFWTRATLPVITVFMHSRFSALNVNDPAKKTGYFFGSYFMMSREAYEGVGTHEGVRGEMIEDGALGRKTKESGRAMMMVRGESEVSAVWARDPRGLWDSLGRLMVPLYLQSRRAAAAIMIAVTMLLVAPFAALAASAAGGPGWWALAAAAGAASAMVYAGAAIEARRGLGIGAWRAVFAPLGGAVVVLGFLAGMGGASVAWRGRRYDMRGRSQDSVNI